MYFLLKNLKIYSLKGEKKQESDEKKNKNFTAKIMYLEKVYKFNNFKRVIAAIS